MNSDSVWPTKGRTGSLTVSGGARLALKAEWGSEACAVIEAPTLLHLGGAGALCTGFSHWWPPVVHWRRLPLLDALTSRARHPYPLLEAQLLAAKFGWPVVQCEVRMSGKRWEWCYKEVKWQTDKGNVNDASFRATTWMVKYCLLLCTNNVTNGIIQNFTNQNKGGRPQHKMEKDQHALQQALHTKCKLVLDMMLPLCVWVVPVNVCLHRLQYVRTINAT